MSSKVIAINPKGLPNLSVVISHGVVVKDAGLVYTSGQLAWDKNGDLVPGDLGAQFKLAYENIDLVLHEAGTSRANVVNETIYLAGYSPDNAAELIKAISVARPPGSLPPSSVAVGVESLFAPGFLVEVQVVAAL
ncbi:RidA family protein [Pseudomonas aeruginosa]|uniref:RidA family protein n=1 Tax=Pseudomonas aeruginosa TaxID=287 RepID=UPI000946A4BD|nr:RidA family protein [Pseudomonas aeruginosa]|eukprot:TRINITY_DN29866_c0_g1_i1.p1 TRINITY_DN29866_c0_g1~~TRINITY_DN29866_c0_g1_i1.p1  ORF type:complete len:135 (+),score=10.04 TRINITY_DN29866_c0_g1_i1:131-535(+)